MTKEELRAQRLIENFPDDSRVVRIKQLWQRQKREESLTLTLVMTCLALSGIPIVMILVLMWPQIDQSPISGIILLGLCCSALLFKRGLKGHVLRVWRYLKK